MNYHCISVYLFFISVFNLLLEIESFIPAGRLAHSSVLVGSKLYFFGGVNRFCSNEVFYLDVSQPFSIASPPWNDLTANVEMPIKNCWGTASLSDSNGEQSIYLFGGIALDIITNGYSLTSLVYKFNTKSERWEIPIIKGKAPERRREMKAVSDNSGKIYIFGGNDSKLGPTTVSYFNDMVILDTGELSWPISYPFNAPTSRSVYSATLLSNGVIVYIGGYESNAPTGAQMVDISQINLYDTNSSTWSTKTAKLIDQIESRFGHTAILASNGRIIIYGGSKRIIGQDNFQATPDVAVLNTETFEWSVPLVSSNIGKVPPLTTHTADLVGNHMIVAFGNITQPNARPLIFKNANIYIMDVRNYTWVNSFEPENIVTSTTPKTENPSDIHKQLPIKVVMGIIIGAIVGIVAFMTAGFIGYKLYQRKIQSGIMRIGS